MDIKVKYFTDKAKMPTQSHPGDAGWDLFMDGGSV